jgi:hypothetical protein
MLADGELHVGPRCICTVRLARWPRLAQMIRRRAETTEVGGGVIGVAVPQSAANRAVAVCTATGDLYMSVCDVPLADGSSPLLTRKSSSCCCCCSM